MAGNAATILQPLQLEASFDLLDLHRLNPRRYPYLLQTVSRAQDAPSWDILFAFPGAALRLDAQGVHYTDESGDAPGFTLCEKFLESFDHWWRRERKDEAPYAGSAGELPFRGGWFLYLGYELCAEIEPTLATRMARPVNLPVASATRIKSAVLYDHRSRRFYCVAEAGCEPEVTAIQRDIETVLRSAIPPAPHSRPTFDGRIQEEPPLRYLDGVGKIKRHIHDGDIFQANLSREWWIENPPLTEPAGIYYSLRKRNPAPFAGLAVFDRFALASSSPERLLRVRSGTAETRPIAGTRPRSSNAAEDTAFSRELIAHPKERAEHIMLIDLERNDLGRICEPGSIQVGELMTVESYAHVHHIVSNISGKLRDSITPGRAIAAVFPGGTITGCPKVRCMEILAELEQGARGPYTGSIGYVNINGDMDLNILIRTVTVEPERISLRAGAGIVVDSEPARELAETHAKAKGLLNALAVADDPQFFRDVGTHHG